MTHRNFGNSAVGYLLTCYVIEQNVNIFSASIKYRPYFGRLKTNTKSLSLRDVGNGSSKRLTDL